MASNWPANIDTQLKKDEEEESSAAMLKMLLSNPANVAIMMSLPAADPNRKAAVAYLKKMEDAKKKAGSTSGPSKAVSGPSKAVSGPSKAVSGMKKPVVVSTSKADVQEPAEVHGVHLDAFIPSPVLSLSDAFLSLLSAPHYPIAFTLCYLCLCPSLFTIYCLRLCHWL